MKCNCKGSNRRSQISLVPIGEESEENEILFFLEDLPYMYFISAKFDFHLPSSFRRFYIKIWSIRNLTWPWNPCCLTNQNKGICFVDLPISVLQILGTNGPCSLTNWIKMRYFVEDITYYIPAKFDSSWPHNFREGKKKRVKVQWQKPSDGNSYMILCL
jgi:hypothetical protein